jgi:NADPH-ferrihemoprotein reductase
MLITLILSVAQAKYLEWVVKDHRNILAVLEDIPSLKPPLDHVLELLPKLQARLYSISSSPKVRHSQLKLKCCICLPIRSTLHAHYRACD